MAFQKGEIFFLEIDKVGYKNGRFCADSKSKYTIVTKCFTKELKLNNRFEGKNFVKFFVF
jgi:hypothetical protein